MVAFVVSTLAINFLCAQALSQTPEISNIYPDFPSTGPHIITGENFSESDLEVWTWNPPSSEEDIGNPLANTKELPENPPERAQKARIVDIEAQIIVAHLSGNLVWVKSGEDFSSPYLINVARPFWLSSDKTQAGDLLHIFGTGLRVKYNQTRIALIWEDEVINLDPIIEARSPRTADEYLVHFEIPLDIVPSNYSVYIHNGTGGIFGWQLVGQVSIASRSISEESLSDVRDFGAMGDGLTDDTLALRKAMNSVQKIGGGTLFFPPGVYRVEETIDVPSGVTLRGAHRDSSVIKGFGFNPTIERRMWYAPTNLPASVIRLSSETAIQSLTVSGFTSKGEGGYGLVEAISQNDNGIIHNIIVEDCKIESLCEHPISGHWLYRSAFAVLKESHHVKFINNDITGNIQFATTRRTEIIGNTMRGGAANEVCTMRGRGIECLIDGNRLVDTPGRIAFYPLWHTYIRYNEIHQAFRGTWANAEEVYLIHGGSSKIPSSPTGYLDTGLIDSKQQWEPGQHQNTTVLITSGKGFGQYRRVLDNSQTTLTLDQPWRVIPDSNSEYVVGPMQTENVFFANLNNTPCRLSLWLDCINNIVDKHRDVFAGGVDVWGQDRSDTSKEVKDQLLHRFHPSYYNAFIDCWLDGSPVKLVSEAKSNRAYRGIPLFGTYIAKNKIRQPYMRRTGFNTVEHSQGGITIGGGSGKVGTSHTILSGNSISFNNVGINVSEWVRKTFILGNEFQEVDLPILDFGSHTIINGNKVYSIDESGAKITSLDNTNLTP